MNGDAEAISTASEPISAPAPHNPAAAIELTLAHDDLHAFARTPGLARRGPSRPLQLLWHDSSDGALAASGTVLVRDSRMWRLERLRPEPDVDWPAAAPAPVLDENASPAALQPAPPADCAPVAAFAGRRRFYFLREAELDVAYGALRGVVGEQKACRLRLAGPTDALPQIVEELSGPLRLAVPRGTLAIEALAAAKGSPAPPRHLGTPALPGNATVTDGLASVIGHLLDALLYWTDRCREAAEPETVHQARVATRRLRSAISIYKRRAACPKLLALSAGLRECAGRLGAARDWDVFLHGTGGRLAQGGDQRVALLLRTARRRRNESYAELRTYLASPGFRTLEIGLGCAAALRPWERTADPAPLQQHTAAFAAEVLDRRLKRVRKAGRNLADLPVPALHELRKDCKRLRYAAEFFAPAFSKPKAFGRRLAALQDELGLLNDTAVAGALMAQLGRVGRGYAGGVVEGWAGAEASTARARIGKAWKRFRTEKPFWHG